MPDVKKLITGFLIVATGAGSAALILSNLGSQPTGGVAAQNPSQAIATSPNAADNAFYPTQGTDIATNEGSAATGQPGDPNNLTDGMADAVATSIVSANQNGIQQDADGNAQITAPDDQTIADALQNEPALQNITAPDWSGEIAAEQSKIRTVQDSSTTITNYLSSFSKLNNQQLIQSGLFAAMESASDAVTPSPSILSNAQPAILKMLSSATASPTPASLLAFQKSFVKLLVYEKNLSILAQNISQDPAKSLTIIQSEDANYDAAVQDFNGQAQVLDDYLSANTQKGTAGPFAWMQDLFFIKTAEAQTPLGVPTIDLTTKAAIAAASAAQTSNGWATYFKKFAEDLGLQLLKNMLMALIQQKVLAYIQNSGAPRFVTNMGTEMVQAGEMSAINAINSNFTCISPTGPLSGIQVTLNAIYKPGNNVCAASFASQLAGGVTPQQFYNKFSNGGFLTFGQTLQPSNNFYGGLFFMSQAANQAQQQSNSLFTIKTTAGQGYRNSQACPDGSDPNGQSNACFDGSGNEFYPNANGSCDPGETKKMAPNYGLCGNGSEPAVTMPAVVNGEALGEALGGSKAAVQGATAIAGVVQAVAQSLLMGLANAGLQAATHAFNGALQGDGGISSIQPGSIGGSTSSSTTALSCSPESPTANAGTQTAFFASGGTYDASYNPPTYSWSSSPDGKTGSGSEFDVTYTTPGTHTVTLTDSANDAAATCSIQVGSSTSPLACAPATANLTVGSSTSFTASGGTYDSSANPPTYSWSSSGLGTMTTASGSTFEVTYGAPGTYTITLSDSAGDAAATCTAVVANPEP